MSSSAWQEDARQIFAKYDRNQGNNKSSRSGLEKHALRGLLSSNSTASAESSFSSSSSPSPSSSSAKRGFSRPGTPGVKSGKGTSRFDFDINEIVDSFSKLDTHSRTKPRTKTRTKTRTKSSVSSSRQSKLSSRASFSGENESLFEFESKDSDDDAVQLTEKPHYRSRSRSTSRSKANASKSRSRSKSKTRLSKRRSGRGSSARVGREVKVPKQVSFSKTVAVCFVSDAEEDKAARRGLWESAPEDDELWDGDLQDFRKVPLTAAELQNVLEQKKLREGEQRFILEDEDYDKDQAWAIGVGLPLDDGNYYDFGYMDDESEGYYESYQPGLGQRDGKVDQGYHGFMQIPLEKWSTDQLCMWLKLNVEGGEYFVDIFQEHAIDGALFTCISERNLRALGIKRNADRAAIVEARDLHIRMFEQS